MLQFSIYFNIFFVFLALSANMFHQLIVTSLLQHSLMVSFICITFFLQPLPISTSCEALYEYVCTELIPFVNFIAFSLLSSHDFFPIHSFLMPIDQCSVRILDTKRVPIFHFIVQEKMTIFLHHYSKDLKRCCFS